MTIFQYYHFLYALTLYGLVSFSCDLSIVCGYSLVQLVSTVRLLVQVRFLQHTRDKRNQAKYLNKQNVVRLTKSSLQI